MSILNNKFITFSTYDLQSVHSDEIFFHKSLSSHRFGLDKVL